MKIWWCPNCKRERKYEGKLSLKVCVCTNTMKIIEVLEDNFKVEVKK